MKRIYLAGPDVFFKNAREHAQQMKDVCARYKIEGVFPLDADVRVDEGESPRMTAYRICRTNEELIQSCVGVIANMEPFRGASMDVGTAWEMGFASALRKVVVGYTSDARLYSDRVAALRERGIADEHEVENFGLVDNLMMVCSAWWITASFEEAVRFMANAVGESCKPA